MPLNYVLNIDKMVSYMHLSTTGKILEWGPRPSLMCHPAMKFCLSWCRQSKRDFLLPLTRWQEDPQPLPTGTDKTQLRKKNTY